MSSVCLAPHLHRIVLSPDCLYRPPCPPRSWAMLRCICSWTRPLTSSLRMPPCRDTTPTRATSSCPYTGADADALQHTHVCICIHTLIRLANTVTLSQPAWRLAVCPSCPLHHLCLLTLLCTTRLCLLRLHCLLPLTGTRVLPASGQPRSRPSAWRRSPRSGEVSTARLARSPAVKSA